MTTGVVSERKKGNCTKELGVQFSLSNSSDETERVCVCVCVNSTSGGERSLATPAYQGRLALVLLPLGAAVNKIKGATLTPPSA